MWWYILKTNREHDSKSAMYTKYWHNLVSHAAFLCSLKFGEWGDEVTPNATGLIYAIYDSFTLIVSGITWTQHGLSDIKW